MADSEAKQHSTARLDSGKGISANSGECNSKSTPAKPLQDAALPCSNEPASSSRSGFFFSTSSMFGSWLSKITDGEKANISSKDLNAFAPTSF
ncbi:hypothetical protein PoB_002501900 [Plakobranchus ocellatus]|uniref:Uncharacterized protein n=1 Tax=Plakobranchus ocellatus TaxID=259542 RepID=A0AAV3ZX65_9GAST|nr:hypothetical protein PoB_002501900 [Plakobranchus ocellatus]